MLRPSSSRSARRPTAVQLLRRRTVAVAVVLAVTFMVVSVIRGDDETPLDAAARGLARTPGALPPWRGVAATGTAGVLDRRGLPARAAQRAAVDRYLALGRPIYCAGAQERYASLTFDDGPGRYSERVLAILRGAGAGGTFFLIGRQVGQAPEVVRDEMTMGAIGDHTWNHPSLPRLGPTDLRFELTATKQVLERVGGTPIDLFRPPYEAHDPSVDARVRAMGMLQILWNVDTRDANGAPQSAVTEEAINGLRPGSIILMHETKPESVAALPRILAAARRRGLRLVSVPQLLALDPPSSALVRAGHAGCGHPGRFPASDPGTVLSP